MNILIVVDMQNDFVSGALGTPEARRIVPAAAERVAAGIRRGERIFFTRDTHGADYLHTREGRNLPVPHCIRGTEGWEIVEQLRPASAGQAILDKPSFGSAELGRLLAEENEKELIEKVTLIGLCTDICVISNALLVKAFLPEAEVAVDAACCAGVTPESHRTALAAMKSCQITCLLYPAANRLRQGGNGTGGRRGRFFGDGTGGDTGGRRRPDGEGDRPGERGLRAF